MKILAVAPVFAEYMYLARTAHAVPVFSAEKICAALNRSRHGLRDGETWHAYDVGPYDNAYYYAQSARFYIRSGRIYEGRC